MRERQTTKERIKSVVSRESLKAVTSFFSVVFNFLVGMESFASERLHPDLLNRLFVIVFYILGNNNMEFRRLLLPAAISSSKAGVSKQRKQNAVGSQRLQLCSCTLGWQPASLAHPNTLFTSLQSTKTSDTAGLKGLFKN